MQGKNLMNNVFNYYESTVCTVTVFDKILCTAVHTCKKFQLSYKKNFCAKTKTPELMCQNFTQLIFFNYIIIKIEKPPVRGDSLYTRRIELSLNFMILNKPPLIS